MKSVKNKKWMLAMVAVALVAGILVPVIGSQGAFGVRQCISEECKEAQAKAAEAEAQANEANQTASMYEAKVNEFNLRIQSQEDAIEKTEERIDELKDEIEETKANLKKKQEALAEMLVDVHFESDKEPIRILAGSESISDLAEKASRENTAKQQIGTAAEAVRDTKQKLEDDKEEVEELLESQQETRKSLVASRKEQQEFVNKYKNDAEGYAKVAMEEHLRMVALEQEVQQKNITALGGGTAYDGAVDTYPWRNQCPQDPNNYNFWNPIGNGYVCECVSYVNWKVYEAYGYETSYGNANEWDDLAPYPKDNVPTAGSVGQTDAGPVGHVFWVESVNGDGSINVTEYNNYWATQLVMGFGAGWLFGARTISADEVPSYTYIHFN